MPPDPSSTGLSAGCYLALTAADLKALRAAKGDRARRDHVAKLRHTLPKVDLGDAWHFLGWLAGNALYLGKALHRGQMTRIELLDVPQLATAIAALRAKDLRAAFFAIDEAKFEYSTVPFWVKKQWTAEGRTTVLDDHVFARVAAAFATLDGFMATAREHVVFTTDY